jgi:hypothetical protein
MSAEQHCCPDSSAGDEARIREPLREQIDDVEDSGREARRRADREVQPDQQERREAECDCARDAGELGVTATPAPEEHERQREKDLHRRLERHRMPEGERES